MTAPASTLTSVAYIYKINYATGIGEVAERMHPGLAKCPKREGFTGSQFNYSVRYGNPQGVSGGFTTGQSSTASSKGVQFAALRFKKYGFISLDGEALEACDSKGSFLDLVTTETNAVIAEMYDRLGFDFYRTSAGIRGQRASVSVNIVTLVNIDDCRNFKIGMTVGASPNADGTSPRTGTTTIAGVSLSAGTITLTSAAAIVAFADNDYLFNAGDVGTCMEGLETCTPLTAPSVSESFRGKDRSVFAELLAGSRLSDANTSIEENAGKVAIAINAMGGNVTTLAVNPVNYWQVVRRGNAKVEYAGGGGSMTFGFERAVIATPAGQLEMISDPDCPTNRGRLWNNDSHYIYTLGELTHVIKADGNATLRATDADSIEARIRSMSNYIQPDTRNHGVFLI